MTKSWSIAFRYLLLWACIHSLGAQVYKFGQSVDLSGSTKEASQNVLDGIITAFDEINQVFNGVRGIPVNLTYMDDGYVPSRAEENSRYLIGNGSLALVGSIGTVSSIQSYPVASVNKVPMIGPITGSGAVRTPDYMSWMIHLSASYEDEAVAFVKYAVQKRLLNRISVFYQNDGFGKSGLKGVHDALSAMRMEIFSSGYFETNSVDIDAGYKNVIKPGQPQAIFFVTVSTQAALFVKRFFDDPNISRPDDTYFCFLSVIDINSFKQFTAGLPMPSRALQTETYPPYQANSSDPVVQRYLRQWAISFSNKQPSSGAVKGFMIGRFLHEALLRIDSTKNITGETIRDVIYNTTMFNIDGTLLGPYLPANIRGGCNQGIKKVWILNWNNNSVEDSPDDALKWDSTGSCKADPTTLKTPLIFGQSLPFSSQDTLLASNATQFLQGLNASFAHQNTVFNGMQGHQLSLISLDDGGNSTRTLENFKSMVQDSQVLGIAGMMESADIADVVRNFTTSNEGSTIPIIGPVSGLQTLRNLKNVLNVRQSYRDEFYAIFRHLRESDIIKAAILCENWDPIMRTACTDAQQALNSTQVPSNLPISIPVNFDSFALETVVDGLNNLRLFDDIKWNIPLQMVIYVGRNASVFMSVAYRMKASNAKLVYATGSFMDRQRLTEEAQKISLDLSKIVHSSPFPYSPLVVEQLKKYNVANDSLTLSAQEGYYVGMMIIAALSRTYIDAVDGQNFLKSVYFSVRLSNTENVQFGPFQESSCNQGLGGSSIVNLAGNIQVNSTLVEDCTVSGVPYRAPDECTVREENGKTFVADFPNAIKVHPIGVGYTLGLLLFVLVEALVVGALAVYKYKSFHMSSHKQVTMVLIKPSFANYFALWTIFFDAVAYVTLILISAKGRFIFDLGPLWKFLRSLGIGVPYGWYHVLGFVVVAIWLFYASIFVRQSLVQSLQRKSTFILLPGTILLPFIATIGFVPVARILLAYVNCKYTKNLAFFDDDCTQRCFTDPHYVWLAVAIVMLALFIPFVMYFSGVWQELQENLDIKYDLYMNISQNFTKIFFSVLINFAASEAIAYLIVHILVYFGLTYQVLKRNPTRIAWIPIWKACGFLVPAWTAIVRLIAQVVGGTQLPEDRDRIAWVWAASLAGGWFILVVATALVHKKRYSTKIFMPKPNNKKKDRLSKMISLFKAKGMGSRSSAPNASQGSLGPVSAEAIKAYQQTVPQWLVRWQMEGKLTQQACDILLQEVSNVNGILLEAFLRCNNDDGSYYKILYEMTMIDAALLPKQFRRGSFLSSGSTDRVVGMATSEVKALRSVAMLGDIQTAVSPLSQKTPVLEEVKEETEETENEEVKEVTEKVEKVNESQENVALEKNSTDPLNAA